MRTTSAGSLQHNMDWSPIPSPAFTNATQSTAMTGLSNTSIRSNLKMRFTDVKNVFLSRPSSFKVQRAKFLMLINQYEATYSFSNDMLETIVALLNHSKVPHAQHLAMEVSDIYRPIDVEFKMYIERMRYAVGMFNTLSNLEHRYYELNNEINRLSAEVTRSDLVHRHALQAVLEQKRAEYSEFKTSYIAVIDEICSQIYFELCHNMQRYHELLSRGAISIENAISQNPSAAAVLQG